MRDKTLADIAIDERAAVLLAAHGIGPDDIERLVRLGVSDTGQIEVLLPSYVDPAVAATLLSLLARSVLDVAQAARAAAEEAERITLLMALGQDRPN